MLRAISFNQLIKPQRPIAEEAIAIHGITNEMVADAPNFEYFVPELQKIFSGKTLLLITLNMIKNAWPMSLNVQITYHFLM